MNLIDYTGIAIRLTDERLKHIKAHPEMVTHTEKINETLTSPDIVIQSKSDKEAGFVTRIMKVFQ
jgi:hypothetical protein